MSRRPKAQEKIAAARLIAKGMLQVDAAKALGIRPESISRWKREPEFLVMIDALKRKPELEVDEFVKLTNRDFQRALAKLLADEIDLIILEQVAAGKLKLEDVNPEVLLAIKQVLRQRSEGNDDE